jgi:hypothetical protein
MPKTLCSDCPPFGYPTDETRCQACPRRAWTATRLPKSRCPFCDYKLDAASGGGTPSPGDISVCIGCASPLRFADDLTVRVMTPAEFARLHPQNQAELRRFMAAVRSIDRRPKPDG